MECMLIPKDPTASLTKVLHLDSLRYDGGDWFSFPQRRAKDWPKLDPNDTLSIFRYMASLPNSREIEAFVQTWLFFGLLSEFFGGNACGKPDTTTATVNDESNESTRASVLGQIYARQTYEDAGKTYITTATLLSDMEEAVKLSFSNKEAFKTSCIRLAECLRMAWLVVRAIPADFDPNIRASISVVAELLSQSMNWAFQVFKLPLNCSFTWTTTYFDGQRSRYDDLPSVRDTMLKNGWCPSDISRSMNNFKSLQMLHFLGKLDKSSPTRGHRQCNDVHCAAYQISQNYKIRHVDPDCECGDPIHIDISAVISILENGESIPLLRFLGDSDDLKIEVVQSSADTPYIAISHVWADGLGNQDANALNRCELIRLRTLVEELWNRPASMRDPFSKNHDGETPYIWIDTLCCPVKPREARNMAIAKIRNVYQHARHVLVLDASLETFKAQKMNFVEQLARIFTSGWLRRLWTLQEGALAESLYFQFADCSVSLDIKKLQIFQTGRDLLLRIFAFDFLSEYQRLQYFYHCDRIVTHHIPPDLSVLNAALQYRSVSIPSDEPLCLACLMGMSTESMLKKDVAENDCMHIFWKLIAEKNEGIPSSIIFFEDERIDARGWRWAPATLLTKKPQLHTFDTRILRWKDTKTGQPTSNGLKVKLQGYHIDFGAVNDSKSRQPWKGVTRLPENNQYYRDVDTMKLYKIVDKEYALIEKSENDKAREAYDVWNNFPINNLISKGKCFVIQGSYGLEGILVNEVPPDETVPPNVPLDGIPVQTGLHVILKEASQAETAFQNAIELLAQELRKDELTDKLLALESNDTQEGKEQHAATLVALKDKMKEMMKKAIQRYPDLGPAIDSLWGSARREFVWVCIGDWFYHDFKASKTPSDQIWYVD